MYCITYMGVSGPSLLIESTDSMIKCSKLATLNVWLLYIYIVNRAVIEGLDTLFNAVDIKCTQVGDKPEQTVSSVRTERVVFDWTLQSAHEGWEGNRTFQTGTSLYHGPTLWAKCRIMVMQLYIFNIIQGVSSLRSLMHSLNVCVNICTTKLVPPTVN